MYKNKINELHQQVIKKMDDGDFKDALNLTYKIKNCGSHYTVSYTVGGLLIDIGSALGDKKIVNEGVELLKKDFEAIIHCKRYASTAYYNLANGYFALFRFKRMVDPYVACFKETELDKVKINYRKALEYDLRDKMLTSQIWVNLGNCFDNLGRVIDALECYEEALKWKPDHGMALGNKAFALCYHARLIDEHQGTFLLEAHSLLSQALRLGVPIEAVSIFSKYLKEIKKKFPDKKVLDNPIKYPGCIIRTKSKFENFLISYCLKNKLYLNICNFCQRCDAAIGDPVVIKKMIIPIRKGKDILENNPYLRLSAYLNQIKQDYITARFLLILSRYKELNLNFVDKRVKIIDTLDYNIHNIYIQLVKVSFKSFYDILDKIAFFINDYLELGFSQREIDFKKVWYYKSKSRMKNKKIHRKIEKTKNFSLNALFDIHRDFENGPYRKLKKTRDALTHRFINIKMFQEIEDEENMKEDTLVMQTLELARIVRNALIYLTYFVFVEESEKEGKLKEILPPMIIRELPDNLKSYR